MRGSRRHHGSSHADRAVGAPTNSRTIINRMQEISFNSSLMREMRTITFVTKLIDDGKMTGGKRMFIQFDRS